MLIAEAQRLIDGDQLALDIGSPGAAVSAGTGSVDNPVEVSAERAGFLLDAIRGAFCLLGLDAATGGDSVFYDLVAARIIHPGSKFESIETLAEVGVQSASYATIKRCLPRYATEEFRDAITHALATHAGIGPGVLVLYDVTTLYFETDQADDLRTPGFSKERRLEPQITVGMLTDAGGLPLSIGAFEGNRAETQTMLPMIQSLAQAYNLDDITVVADAGMFSAANKKAIVDAGLGYILGTKERRIPYPVQQWRDTHPGQDYTDGQIWSFADRSGRGPDGTPHAVTYYQYSWDRARRSRRGIDEQLAKAERAVAGKAAVKRNRYVNLKAPKKTVNYELADKHRALAGIKGYETNRVDLTAEQVIDAYRQLFKIEKSFRMAKSDLRARPIYHRKQDSIDAHLTIVMSAMACGHILEQATDLSLKRLVRTLKKYRSFTLDVAGHTIHATTPVPHNVQTIIQHLPKPD
nr:IS1634-like element IS1549 family transposase [Brevibacterium otitidis]BFF07027.1 IS1634-like element IS1549 family transposase [Brevibacterium otitidis]BFF08183.1 IS1634-like element IS1549 family transposase [Brevibacterium otitidis]